MTQTAAAAMAPAAAAPPLPRATVTVAAGDLCQALTWIAPIARSRVPGPPYGLAGLRWEAGRGLRLTACTIGDPTRSARVALSVVIPPVGVIPAEDNAETICDITDLLALAKLLPKRQGVILALEDTALRVTASPLDVTLPHQGEEVADLLPQVAAAPEDTDGAAVDPAALRAWLGAVAPCIGREETRYYLNGIYLEARRGHLLATATDGHRLRRRALPQPVGVTGGKPLTGGTLLPRQGWERLSAILTRAMTARLLLRDDQVHVETRQRDGLTARLSVNGIDGTYPAYRRVVPKGVLGAFAVLDRAATRTACRHIAALRGRSPLAKVALCRDAAGVLVTATGGAEGRGVTLEAPVGTTAGPWGGVERLGVNARYMMQMIGGLGAEVTLRAKPTERCTTDDNTHGGALWLSGPDSGPYDLDILMPMRL